MAPSPVTPAAAEQADRRGSRARVRRRILNGWVFFLMVVVAVVMLYPFYYLLDNAFRTQAQFDQQRGHSLSSWSQLFGELPVGRELANSLLICVA